MSKSVIAKYIVNKETFEILVDSELAYEYITGKRSDPLSVLEADDIFKDVNKGERQSEDKIKRAFNTTDLATIVSTILKKGTVPITTEQRNKLMEEKRKHIIDTIARNAIDPRTNAPMPTTRIENAMKEARITIDPFKNANEQIDEIVEKLSPIIPIKFALVKIEVVIPAELSNRSYSVLKRYGMKSEKWLSNGNLDAIVEFPAGLQNEFYNAINNATQGRATTKIIT